MSLTTVLLLFVNFVQSLLQKRPTTNLDPPSVDIAEKAEDFVSAVCRKVEQLSTSLAEYKGKLFKLGKPKCRLKEALVKEKKAWNANYQDLGRKTLGSMSSTNSNLLQERDDQILELQKRVEQLEKGTDENIGQVAPDFYKLLGIERHADTSDIKRAYHAKCLKHHPDKHQNSPDLTKHEAIFQTLKYGYEILNHPATRVVYDRWLDMVSVRRMHLCRYGSF